MSIWRKSHIRHEGEAARLFLRLQDDDVSPAEIEATLAWQAQNPAHAAAFARVEKVWHLAGALPDPIEVATGSTRRTWIAAAIAASALPLLVMAGMHLVAPLATIPETVQYTTGIGESRTVLLNDNSQVMLSGATEISVTYSDRKRHIALRSGEAIFTVAKDKDRPFVVEAGDAEAIARGTVFDIHRHTDNVTLTVMEGVVQLQPVAAGEAAVPAVRLGSGNQVRYSSKDGLGAITRVPLDRALAWREGKFIFSERALGDVVADLNRYSHKRIILDEPTLGEMQVTGSVMAGAAEEWLQSLSMVLPVKVQIDAEKILISRSGAPHAKQPEAARRPGRG